MNLYCTPIKQKALYKTLGDRVGCVVSERVWYIGVRRTEA